MQRINYASGAPLEEKVGYSRMIRVGDHVYIGGTTALQPDGSVYGTTAYEQAHYIFGKFTGLLTRAGGKAEDVIKIKAYLMDMAFAGEVGTAYSKFFKEIRPLLTMVETPKLNRPTQLVEIEAEAVLGCRLLNFTEQED